MCMEESMENPKNLLTVRAILQLRGFIMEKTR